MNNDAGNEVWFETNSTIAKDKSDQIDVLLVAPSVPTSEGHVVPPPPPPPVESDDDASADEESEDSAETEEFENVVAGSEDVVDGEPSQKMGTRISDLIKSTIGNDPKLQLYREGPSDLYEYLMKTIAKLEYENEALKEKLDGQEDIPSSEKVKEESQSDENNAESDGLQPVIFELVHKVKHNDGNRNYFRDIPKKFKGDLRKDHLRGRTEIENPTKYLDEHPKTSFLVFKEYSCDKYLSASLQSWTGLKAGRLVEDTAEAESKKQSFALNDNTKRAILKIINSHRDKFTDIKPEETLKNYFPRFYAEPFYFFYLHNKDLKALASSSELDDDDVARVTVLTDWLEENWRADWDEADALLAQGKINKKHTMKMFRPGEIVVWKHEEVKYIASKLELYPWDDEKEEQADMFRWEFNGSFYKVNERLNLFFGPSEKEGEKEISTFDFMPIRFAPTDTYMTLLSRGEKFWKYRDRKLVQYKHPKRPTDQSRYIVDYAMYKRMYPYNYRFDIAKDDLGDEASAKEQPPEGDLLALLPGKILAFDFVDKSWTMLQTEFITDVTWNKDAFGRLVVPDDTKELVKALVQAQREPSDIPPDIIAGKGCGLLILLHGPPGTGKTLTAESIAELEEKPLYRVTCGDIGLEPDQVERYLQRVFELAKAWGCVVLLDEADVFVEARGFDKLKRNAVISVFLRLLEYFEGILILTTNRVGTFDEAFKSRIQLSLKYPRLDRTQRKKIWQNLLKMIAEDRDHVNVTDLEQNVDELADVPINGRQIRNAIVTARHLANFRKERMLYQHLKVAIDKIRDFDEYLKEVKYQENKDRMDDDHWARELRLR